MLYLTGPFISQVLNIILKIVIYFHLLSSIRGPSWVPTPHRSLLSFFPPPFLFLCPFLPLHGHNNFTFCTVFPSSCYIKTPVLIPFTSIVSFTASCLSPLLCISTLPGHFLLTALLLLLPSPPSYSRFLLLPVSHCCNLYFSFVVPFCCSLSSALRSALYPPLLSFLHSLFFVPDQTLLPLHPFLCPVTSINHFCWFFFFFGFFVNVVM